MNNISFSNVSFTNLGNLALGHKCSELRYHLGGFFLDEYEVFMHIYFDYFLLDVYFIRHHNGFSSMLLYSFFCFCWKNFPALYSDLSSLLKCASCMKQNYRSYFHINSVNLYILLIKYVLLFIMSADGK